MSDRILLAEITAAHGIKGLVKLRYYGEDVNDLHDYNPLYTSEAGHDALTLQVKNAVKGGYVAEIEGILSRNDAERLRGTKLYIDQSALPAVEEGSYYHSDLLGCVALEDGAKIGSIIAIENYGAGDLLEIKPATGESFYLPFKDEFVGEVNIDAKTIEVIIPEGLRD